MLVSGVQRSDSVLYLSICRYMDMYKFLFQILFHYWVITRYWVEVRVLYSRFLLFYLFYMQSCVSLKVGTLVWELPAVLEGQQGESLKKWKLNQQIERLVWGHEKSRHNQALSEQTTVTKIFGPVCVCLRFMLPVWMGLLIVGGWGSQWDFRNTIDKVKAAVTSHGDLLWFMWERLYQPSQSPGMTS